MIRGIFERLKVDLPYYRLITRLLVFPDWACIVVTEICSSGVTVVNESHIIHGS